MRRFVCLWVMLFLIPVLTGIMLWKGTVKEDKGTEKQKNIEITYLDTVENKVKKAELEEYLVGVVAAEMPAEYHIEALKAQAVAARSYILKKTESENPDHKGADVCDNPQHCKGHIDEKKARKQWDAKKEEEYIKKIKAAVEETRGEYMVYNGETVEAFFFARSGGRTENSGDVWSEDKAYLKSVESEGDLKHPQLYEEKSFSNKDTRNKLYTLNSEIQRSDKPLNIGEISRTEGGSVKEILIDNCIFRGKDIRIEFGLRSANFTVSTTANEVTFKTAGYGHGVGMSQYGANYMAENGKNYTEILSHYYSNIQIAGK